MSTVKRLEASENTNFLRPLSDEHLAFGQPSDPVAIPESGAINGNPRYVPYTVYSSSTCRAYISDDDYSSPQQHQGDVTSKLQLVHSKAAAQNIGLDSGTFGWSILEKLVLDCDY